MGFEARGRAERNRNLLFFFSKNKAMAVNILPESCVMVQINQTGQNGWATPSSSMLHSDPWMNAWKSSKFSHFYQGRWGRWHTMLMTSCLAPDVNREERKCKMEISPQASEILDTEGEHKVATLNTLRFHKIKGKRRQGKILCNSDLKFQVQATENRYHKLNIHAL